MSELEIFIEKLETKLNDYEMDLWERLGIDTATCDVLDVYKWIEEAKEEMNLD